MPVVEGDPFGDIKEEKKSQSPPPRDVNQFHERADTDSGPLASHHTLGIGANQASKGDHVHDGKSSRKVGQGLNLTCNTLSVSDAVKIQSMLTMLHNVIEFTET